ncbi:DUF262 domain-containing protein [Paenibacillus sp. Mc5Re-14]|uniref:DUF262 domain-containing protein n=1 Tax=Paenibacillus sp. Mc5Re-14 TaxID=1030529 RepID=UPI000A4928F3|nr:DUF262 domain-containing protein [Paenibacillus sp. Mc5Re-14]
MAKTTKTTEGTATNPTSRSPRKPPLKTAAQKKAEAAAKLKEQQKSTSENEKPTGEEAGQVEPPAEPSKTDAGTEVNAGTSEISAGEEDKKDGETEQESLDKQGEKLEDLADEEFDKGKRDGVIEDEDKGKELLEGQMMLEDDGEAKIGENKLLKDSEKKGEGEKFVRKTRIVKSTSDVTIKSLFKEWRKDQIIRAQRKADVEEAKAKGEPIPDDEDETTLRFDRVIQRNETWSDIQKSDLIHSVLYGYYIPPVLVEDSSDGKKWFLDGKQRLTTLLTYIDGVWALSKKTKNVYGFKISGMKFKDLPIEMQEEILDETITLVLIKNMTEAERDEMFVKQNSGSPLTRIEMTRAMHSELIESINELANLPFFKDDIELSRKARNRFVDQEIILQIAMLLEEGKEKIKGFGAGHIEQYVLRLKESDKTISDELIQQFEEVSTYLTLAFEDYDIDEIKKSLKKIHIPIIFWNAQTAMEEGLQPKLYGDFIRSFLITRYSVESKYGKSCQAGSSKKENVLIRLDEMSASLKQFTQMIRQASSMEEGVQQFDRHLADVNGIDRQMDMDDEQETA